MRFSSKSTVANERVQKSFGSMKLQRIGRSLKYRSDVSDSLLIDPMVERRSVSKSLIVGLRSKDDGFFKSFNVFKVDPTVLITSIEDGKDCFFTNLKKL